MDNFYATGSDPYKDPATGVLRNKLGIADQASLDQAEIELVTPEILRLTLQATWGVKDHDFNDFCQLHRELFGQIYEWAGEARTVQIAKGDTRFCRAEHILAEGVRIFSELRADKYLGQETSQSNYVAKLAYRHTRGMKNS